MGGEGKFWGVDGEPTKKGTNSAAGEALAAPAMKREPMVEKSAQPKASPRRLKSEEYDLADARCEQEIRARIDRSDALLKEISEKEKEGIKKLEEEKSACADKLAAERKGRKDEVGKEKEDKLAKIESERERQTREVNEDHQISLKQYEAPQRFDEIVKQELQQRGLTEVLRSYAEESQDSMISEFEVQNLSRSRSARLNEIDNAAAAQVQLAEDVAKNKFTIIEADISKRSEENKSSFEEKMEAVRKKAAEVREKAQQLLSLALARLAKGVDSEKLKADLAKREEEERRAAEMAAEIEAVAARRTDAPAADSGSVRTAPAQAAKAASTKSRFIRIGIWAGLIAGSAAAVPFIYDWQPSQKIVDKFASFGQEGPTANPRNYKTNEEAQRIAANMKKAIEAKAAEKQPEPKILTKEEQLELAKKYADEKVKADAARAAAKERKASEALIKANANFKAAIFRMKEQKYGFLWRKSTRALSVEIGRIVDRMGGLDMKPKNRLTDRLNVVRKRGMIENDLLSLHEFVNELRQGRFDAEEYVKREIRRIEKEKAKGKTAELKKKGAAAIPAASAVSVKGQATAQPKKEQKATEAKKTPTKGPKDEKIITTVSAPVSPSTGAVIPASVLAPTYSVSGGIKPPWLDWAAGVNPPEKLIDAAEHMKKEIARIDKENARKAKKEEAKKPEPQKDEKGPVSETAAQEGLMIVGNTIYTYPGQRLKPQNGRNINGFLTKAQAETAYNAATEAAAKAIASNAEQGSADATVANSEDSDERKKMEKEEREFAKKIGVERLPIRSDQ